MVDVSSLNIGSSAAGIANNASSYFQIVIVVLLIICVAGFWWFYRRYNINVRIYTKGTPIIGNDRGMIKVYKNGEKVFKLLKSKQEIPIPDYDMMLFSKKKKQVDLLKVSEDTYFPVKAEIISRVHETGDLDDPNNIAKVVPTEARNWFIQQQARSRQKLQKQSFWQQYGNVISIGILVVAMIVGMWIIAGMLQDTIDKLPGIISAAKAAGTSVAASAF